MSNKTFMVVVTTILGIIALGTIFGEPPKPDIPLAAQVRVAAGLLFARNFDQFDWRDCDFELNDDYRAKVTSVTAGEQVILRLGDFTKSDGTRFDQRATKPLRAFLYCRSTPYGVRSSLHGWN